MKIIALRREKLPPVRSRRFQLRVVPDGKGYQGSATQIIMTDEEMTGHQLLAVLVKMLEGETGSGK